MQDKLFSLVVHIRGVLLLALLSAACTIQRLTPTLDIGTTSTPTMLSPAPTLILSSNLLASLQTTVVAIETNQPTMLRSLIGEEGVAVGGFAQELNFKGYNNADEIVEAFTMALSQSQPICKGFVSYAGALPDKAILIYQGIKFDWSQFGLSQISATDSMTLQLFKLSDDWRLVYITPFDLESDLPILGPLQDCSTIR